ncbi:hypothetical protein [Nocardia flavorosea]|uniref:hypothetical protein n=1 Tax=Nocardia flavorosea TaxID=53429 RepID=UPI0007A49633|nr:hypothetical protein [Nocardia flavorosea]
MISIVNRMFVIQFEGFDGTLKTLASPSPRDPRWLQIIPSSECAPWKRQWPVVPTYSHGGLDYGTIVAPDRTPA